MIGRALGQYVIAERIGAGSMGEVYRAHDTRLERDVALKVVAKTLIEDEQAHKRLQKEARALSRLNHPNIAAVYDFDIVDEVAFVAMELVPGVDLRNRISTGALPEKDVINLGAQAADALQAAHVAGVVHRDLKPANIRITPEGRLKVLDFGLAARVARPEEVSKFATQTISSEIAGTVPYMPPEQLRGEPADPRSDIYSLCAVLYEMATGVRPFDARPEALLIEQILNEAPAPPRGRNPRVSPALEALVLKGLEKSPERRYQSTRELLVDFERLRTPATETVRPPSRRRALWLPASRIQWTAAVVTVASLLGIVAWLMWRGPLSGPVLSFSARDWILVADFDNQTGEAVFDTSLATAFSIGLGQSTYANLVPKARIEDALRRMGRKDSPRIDEQLGREICVREGVRGLLTPGISRIGQRYALSAKLVDPRSGAGVKSYVEQATSADGILDALGRIGDAVRRDLGESLASIRQDGRPLPQVTTASLEALQSYADGGILWRKGQYREALVHYQRAVERDREFAMAHSAIGSAYLSFVVNEPALGKKHLDQALALAERTTERERMILQATYQATVGARGYAVDLYRAYLYRYPDDYSIRYNFGGLLRELSRFDEAAAEYQEVLRLSPGNASAFINLATAHVQAGRARDALVAYDKAFALEPTWKTGGNLNHEYGFTLVRAARTADARDVFGLALTSREERPRGLRSLALLDLYGGKYRDARARLIEAVRLNQTLSRSLSVGRDLFFLAIVAEGLGARHQALAYLDQASEALQKTSGLGFLARVGVAYARAGELAKARRLLPVTQRLLREGDPAQRDEVLRLEGELLVAEGQTDAGLRLLTEAHQQLGGTPVLTKESLAHAYERSGNVDTALTGYEELLREDALGWEPQQAWLAAHYHLARIHVKRGDPSRAQARLDTLLALWQEADPDLPLLQAARQLRNQLSGIR